MGSALLELSPFLWLWLGRFPQAALARPPTLCLVQYCLLDATTASSPHAHLTPSEAAHFIQGSSSDSGSRRDGHFGRLCHLDLASGSRQETYSTCPKSHTFTVTLSGKLRTEPDQITSCF